MTRYSLPILSGIAVLPLSIALAGPIYTWTDSNGVTHFSETPPQNEAIESTALEVQRTPARSVYPDDNYFSVIRQAERMQSRRLENEKLKAERQKAEAEARRALAEANAANQPYVPNDYYDNRYIPVYSHFGYGRRYGNRKGRGYNPGHGYRPDRPVNLPGRHINPPRIRGDRPAHRRVISAAAPGSSRGGGGGRGGRGR